MEEGTDGVQHETVDSLAGGDHHHGGAAVESVARCHEVPARLQGVFLRGLIVGGLSGGDVTAHTLKTNASPGCLRDRRYLSVDGKDGADGYEAVDVGGAVERIKTHDIFALDVKKTAEVIRGFRCLEGVAKDFQKGG